MSQPVYRFRNQWRTPGAARRCSHRLADLHNRLRLPCSDKPHRPSTGFSHPRLTYLLNYT